MQNFFTTLAAILVAVTATAADLNTEVPTTTRVTIRSEIERGISAAPNPLDFSILHYNDAVQAVENRNKQQNTDSEPFRFGRLDAPGYGGTREAKRARNEQALRRVRYELDCGIGEAPDCKEQKAALQKESYPADATGLFARPE